MLPGLGQIMNGPVVKGLVIATISILTGYLCGLASVLAAVEAYKVAQKREAGTEVGDWDWF